MIKKAKSAQDAERQDAERQDAERLPLENDNQEKTFKKKISNIKESLFSFGKKMKSKF